MTAESFTTIERTVRTEPIDVVQDGNSVEIATRSAKGEAWGGELHEKIRFDVQGIPVEWRVSGTSVLGGEIAEEFTTDGSTSVWHSQSGDGSVATDAKVLYLPADASDLAGWIYARAALAAGGQIQALPTGTVHATPMQQADLDLGLGSPIKIFTVTGATLTPQFVLMEMDGRLVAVAGGDRLVLRDDLLDHQTAVERLVDELTKAHLANIQHRVLHRYDAPVRMSNVRVFDPAAQRLGEPVSVTWFRGRITAVQPQDDVPSGRDELVIDGAGGTLVAGLHDMHAHVAGWHGLFYLAAGVTCVRDMGNNNEFLLDLQQSFDSGELAGPTIVRSGYIEGVGGGIGGKAVIGVIPDTLDEALEAVRWYGDRGYHQIKIYQSMNPAWVSTLTAEAHRLGMRATGHIPAFTTPDQMIEDGYDEITHINQLTLGWLLEEGEDTRSPLRITAMARARDLDLTSERVRRTIDLMRERGIGLDTTAVTFEQMMLGRPGEIPVTFASIVDHLPVSYQRDLRRPFLPASTDEEFAAYEAAYAKVREVLRMLHREGIKLWPGTDAGIGFTVHRELELYVSVGIKPAETLAIATRGCAEHLGLDHTYGTIERGKAASFVLLDGDPTTDISAVRRPRTVVKNGDIYYPSEIYAELGIKPFTEPARVDTTAVGARP